MSTIFDIRKKYCKKIDSLDFELILEHILKKTRSFVLAHPEFELSELQQKKIEKLIARRAKGEPVAYLTGHKEFYGLDFTVDKNTLIPRPETELIVEEVLKIQPKNRTIIDVGTGSGNIIIGLAKNIRSKNTFLAIDISAKALIVAKRNARKNKIAGKIKFLRGHLLNPLLKAKKLMLKKLVIAANLPYLSKEIYQNTPVDVKKYEPKSALYSAEAGLDHYRKLLAQIGKMRFANDALEMTAFLEISPEQKKPLAEIIKSILPAAKSVFMKDLAGKWRICKISL